MLRKVFTPAVLAAVVGLLFTTVAAAHADTLSLSGNLASGNGVVFLPFAITSDSDIVIQTYGYGGGTNAAGTTFSGQSSDGQSGFLPTLGLYDAGGNLMFDSTAAEYGCNDSGPGAANLDSSSSCGDVYMSLLDFSGGTAGAGAYTLVIFTPGYTPDASLPSSAGPLLAFALDRNDGQVGTTFYAVDITGDGIAQPAPASQVPVPASVWLFASAIPALVTARKRASRRS